MPACPLCATAYELPARFCGSCGASLEEPGEPVEEQDPWVGRVVDRRYRVLARIGHGGMGLVYRVEHMQLGKVAAMKVLYADLARDSESVRRFRTEAQAVSRLNHPNIVQTFDFGSADGALYLVMEFIKGEDLAAVIKREGPLPFMRAAPLFTQICSALTEAHEAGIIHRDLKPENIMVVARRDGTAHAKVLDFGLAKLHERAGAGEITSGGQVIGTPYYMSPEQVRAEPLDVRTDIYSLGATLYRVLTGTPPFQAATPVGVLTKHITDPLEPPRLRAPELHLPIEADAIVARAMAKDREERYAAAADVQKDLEAALDRYRREMARDPDTVRTARLERPPPRPVARAWTAKPVAAEAVTEVARVGATAAAAGAVEADAGEAEIDSDGFSLASGERLRRRDFDAFERSLRRRRLLAMLVVPAVLVAIGAGVLIQSRKREKAVAHEREPNDSAAQANLLPQDSPVEGRVGARLADGRPDLDYFRVPLGKGTRAISARLEGIPNVDLVLELYDGRGEAVGRSDAHRAGGGEWLQPTTVGPGEAFLLVRQIWIQGTSLVENAPDPYRLSVHWARPLPGWELEPNDDPDRATALEIGRSVKGYLASAEDVDWYAVTAPAAGRLRPRVAAPDGVPIIVVCGRTPLPGAPAPAKGHAAKSNPAKADPVTCPVAARETTVIGLSRHVVRGATGGGSGAKAEELVGLDDPYELTVELTAD